MVCLSVLLATSSCTEPNDGVRPNDDGSQIGTGDSGSPSDRDAAGDRDGRADGVGDGSTDRPAPAHLSVDSASHDFGLVPVGTASMGWTFIVSNDGGSTSDGVSAMLDAAAISAGFSITDECSGNPLAAGTSCHVIVGFSPPFVGKQQGSVLFHATGFDASATLLGEGITPGTLTIDPPMQDFGLVVMPAHSIDRTFTVKNTGEGSSGMIATRARRHRRGQLRDHR